MADAPLRIGIVGATPGTGWAPRAHIPAYKVLPEVELFAVCTAHEETARAAAEQYGARRSFTDYQKMAADPEIDVVSVATRVLLHYPISRAALEAGKHVYCEWPLCVTSAQAEELVELARHRNLRTMTGLQARYAPALVRMKELVDEGYLGRPLTFHLGMMGAGALTPRGSSHAFTAKKEAGAGGLAIAGGHSIDGLRWILGAIESLSASVDVQLKEWVLPDTGERVEVTTPDNVAVVARLANGMTGTIQISNTAFGGEGFHFDVYGTEGKLRAKSPGLLELSLVRLYGARGKEPEAEIAIPGRLKDVPELPMEGNAYNIARLFRTFAASIRSGKDASPSFSEGASLHRLLEAIDRASETRSWVKL